MSAVLRQLVCGLVTAWVIQNSLAMASDCKNKTECTKDIVDTAVAAGSFKTLVTAVKTAGLVDALKSEGPLTVFAPTDEAFAKLPTGTVEKLLGDKQKLAAILKYHVVPGKVLAADVGKIDSAKTLQGSSVEINTCGGVKINDAKVVKADILTSNGVIHVIDTVLIPDGKPKSKKSFASMFIRKYDTNSDGKLNADEYPAKYRKYFGKTDTSLDGYVDNAELTVQMEKLKEQWRERMRERAASYRERNARRAVEKAIASDANGDGKLNADEAAQVIRKPFGEVDSDLDGYLSRGEIEVAYGVKPNAAKTIVETAQAAGSFKILVKAAVAAELDGVLQSKGPFTVFAPTDDAFAKVPKDVLEGLLKDKQKLAAVLKYHVVAGKVKAGDVVKLSEAATVQGSPLKISVSDSGVKVDNANVVKTDIDCSNGVIHVIDAVLLPPATSSSETAEADNARKTKAVAQRKLFRFKDDDSAKKWRTVNDTVMGGRSKGSVRLTDDGTMEFYGDLSLQNNGGFASARSVPQKLELGDGDSIVARIRGDGRKYYLNLYSPTYRIAFSYRAPVQTEKDKWMEVSVPLSDFYATSFGRRVNNVTLKPSQVNSVGFLLADKQPGPFRLEVDSIRVRKSND